MSFSPFRHLVVALAAMLLLLTGCGSGEPGGEQDSVSLQRFEGDGFAIDLPGEPESTTQTVATAGGDIELTLYTVDFDDSAVVVAVTPLPEGTPIDLDGSVNGAAANVGGTVLDSETGEFAGYETRDGRISVEQSGQKGTGFLRVLNADGRLVQIQQIVAGENVTEAPASYQAIVDSLELS